MQLANDLKIKKSHWEKPVRENPMEISPASRK
jgi:hypothetical protein